MLSLLMPINIFGVIFWSACEIIVMQVGYRHIDYAQLYYNEIENCGSPLLVSVMAEWVIACEGEREIVAEGLWRLRTRWVAGSIGLAGTPLLGGGADGKNQGKRGR
ncbi:hypothetical protein POTOM_062179 [Populus tomentosa]|uniref:Uncharacterized protein n=1 Tax=Populus tomentosa TaxID=118781 RepID=A0A8X8BZA7_POPTO|nr:hypothetical protein POTOM_062179 [Populus tomentosa]